MDEQEIKILETAIEQFITYGVKSVTMDDVAREMAISKKTLYRYVNNKPDLVHKCVTYLFSQITSSLEDIQSKSTNAIDELFDFNEQLQYVMRAQRPSVILQLRKHYPETFVMLMNMRKDFVMKLTMENLIKGIRQGVYRNDLNVDYIALLYYAQTMMFNQENLVPDEICTDPDFNRENLIYHIRGIASDKGLLYLKQKIKRE